MSRISKYLLILFVITSISVMAVYAGLHFVGSATTGYGSFKATIDVSGFGSDAASVTVTTSVSGNNLIAWCQNNGGKRAPGQNTVSVGVSNSQVATIDANGRATADFHIDIRPSWQAAGCPNKNWVVTDLVGQLFATITATDTSTGESVSQTYQCDVNEPQQTVTCNRTS